METVAIRMPSHPVAMKLIKDSGVYIAAPSANLSGRPSPTTAAHVEEDLSGRIDMILDGGPVGIGIESTIVDVTGDRPTILRPGYISADMIKNILGDVMIDPALESVDMKVRPKAPGMKYTHYAPKGKLTIVEGERERLPQRLQSWLLVSRQKDIRRQFCVIQKIRIYIPVKMSLMREAKRMKLRYLHPCTGCFVCVMISAQTILQ